jgi:hypothetical protein
MINTAVLPDELVERKPRHLRDLEKGATGHITFTELIVREDKGCLVNLDAELRGRCGSTVEVTRRDDDGFHVTIPADTLYQPGRLGPRMDLKLHPVASISIGEPNNPLTRGGRAS